MNASYFRRPLFSTRGKAPYPMTYVNGRKQYVMVDVEIDEELLKEIAK